MIINHNMASLNTYRQLSTNNANSAKSLEKLSSGLRINKAGDDAAGLAISEKMRGQIRGLDQASRNAQDSISMIQTAEGSLSETHSILQRMKELATQSANDTNVGSDRTEIQKEINQLTSEINRIGNTTEFNTQKLLNGGIGKTGQVLYSVATAGVAETTPTGVASAISTVTTSVKAGTASVSGITTVAGSVTGAAAQGIVSPLFTTTASSVAGTGATQLFRVETASVKAANDGTVGSPFEVDTQSVALGTGAMNFSEIVAGAGGTTATYGVELKANFTDGDTIQIGTQTFTAKAAGAGANEFNIGATLTETRDNLKVALGGATYVNGGVTYNLSTSDPTWTASNDNNLLVFTNAAGNAIDANAAPMNASAITQVVAQAGVYKFEVGTNFEAGQKLTIAGHEFTAATAGGNTATQFQIGADFAATATALKAALDAAKIADPANLGNYNITQGAAGSIYEDTITLTEAVASGTDMAAPTINNVAEVRGVYSFELKTNYSDGDTIKIGGQTLTATTGATDATNFTIGADVAATATALKNAINLNGTLSARFDAVAGAGSFGNNNVTLTEKATQATGSDIVAPVTTKVAETLGSYDFSVVKNFVAGEKITIAGQDFVAKASGAVAANGEFNVGADTDLTTASLKDALTAKLGTHYTVGGAASQVTLVENATTATGAAPVVGAVSGVGEERGNYTFTLTANASVGDKITIAGQDFVGVSGAAVAGQFKVGSSTAETTDNLVAAINGDATIGTGNRFTASKLTDNTDPLNPVYSVKLYEDGGLATGVAATAVTTKVTEVQGAYTFNVDTNFAVKDKIEIGGQTFTAKASGAVAANGEFNVGSDAAATATSLTAAINANTTLKNHYLATSSGSGIALVEKATQATGVAVAAPDVKGDATAGKFKFAANAMAAGTKLTIDDVDLTIATGGTEVQTAAELKSLVDANSTLNAKYDVAVSGADVTLTQKAGEESSTAPKLTYTTQAGSGFLTQMQIGANTGQSMTLDIKDMRSMALEVSSAAGAPGQTVTVDGKEYAVKWTATQSVTNGTDNVSQEFALDVSTHDNATAAVAMIQSAIEEVSAERSKLGAYTNRLEHTATNLGTSSENLTAAESRVRDVDMAKEMMQFQKNNILSQAAQAMLAQANQQPQGVLQLLR